MQDFNVQEQPKHFSEYRIVRRVSRVLIAISSIALAIMMFLSIGDVGGRFFNHPIQGTFEIVSVLLLVSSAPGLGWCQYVKGNVNIDILVNKLSRRGQAILNAISYFMSIVVSVIVCWQGSLMTFDYMFKKVGGKTEVLSMVLWPFMLIMVIGFAWVTVIFIIDLYKSITEALK